MTPLRTDEDTGAVTNNYSSSSPQQQPNTEVWEEDTNDSVSLTPNARDTGAMEPPAKKRRKDVSPEKYFEILEEDNSSKFGCSHCGNIYKWKKSLNKHWKEKHTSDPGDNKPTPPGMDILLQQGNYIQTRLDTRQVFHKMLLEKITVKQDGVGPMPSAGRHTPEVIDGRRAENRSPAEDVDEVSHLSCSSIMPTSLINLGNNSQSFLLTIGQKLLNNLHSPFPSSIIGPSPYGMDEPDGMEETVQPLDFSGHKAPSTVSFSSTPGVDRCADDGVVEKVEVLPRDQQATSKEDMGGQGGSRCGEATKTETASKECLSKELPLWNKHLVKCPMCPKQFPVFSALETHFLNCHTVCTNLSLVNQAVSTSDASYEMEEGEIDPNHPLRVTCSTSANSPASFFFDQVPGQATAKDKVIALTSPQSNFVNGLDHVLPASSSSSPLPTGQEGGLQGVGQAPGTVQRRSPSASTAVQPGDPLSTENSPVQDRNSESHRNPLETLNISQSHGKRSEAGGSSDMKTGFSSKLCEDYKCEFCDFRAKWPNMVMEHMKIHSSPKPYRCPNCSYASKWKWDVSKHLHRCGNGGKVQVLLEECTKQAPPNVTVTPDGDVVQCHETTSPGLSRIQHDTTRVTSAPSDSPPTSLVVPDHETGSSCSPLPSNSPLTQQASSQQPLRDSPTTNGCVMSESQHHCPHCTFSCSTVADLLHHQVMYSHKPYRCQECGYSTKWKHDLKKHKCPYRHFIKNSEPNHGPQKSDALKCPSCSFETHIRKALIDHVKRCHSVRTSGKKSPAEVLKFKCKQCQFITNDFSRYVQHRQSHMGETDSPRQSSPVNDAEEPDEARLKHPRKKVHSYSCKRCSFVCAKSIQLLDHRNEVHDIYQCLYCPERFDIKDGLLDHLLNIHPDINLGEWCLYFGVDNDDDLNNNMNAAAKEGFSKVPAMDKSIISVSPALESGSATKQASETALRCKWCGEGFHNVVRLYSHVRCNHTEQFRHLQMDEGVSPNGQQSQLVKVQQISVISPSREITEGGPESPQTLDQEGNTTARHTHSTMDTLFQVPSTTLPHEANELGQQPSHTAAQPSPPSTAAVLGLNLTTKSGTAKPTASSAGSSHLDKPKDRNRQLTPVHTASQLPKTAERRVVNAQLYRSALWNNRDVSRCLLCFAQQESPLAVLKHLQQQHPEFVKEVKWPDSLDR